MSSVWLYSASNLYWVVNQSVLCRLSCVSHSLVCTLSLGVVFWLWPWLGCWSVCVLSFVWLYSGSNLDWVVGQSVLCRLSGCILALILTGLLISLCYLVCLTVLWLWPWLGSWSVCVMSSVWLYSGSNLDWVVDQSVLSRLPDCALALALTGLLVSLCYVVCLDVFWLWPWLCCWSVCVMSSVWLYSGSDRDWVVEQSVLCRLSGCILALILTGLLISLCYVVCLVVFWL
jgi:hypothetical protein